MAVAKVIVDVPSSNVNQTFDYEIPAKYKHILKAGMRVVIPFGPRKITGFVMQITEHSEHDHLKAIIDVLDIEPVLTEELLALGKWLAKTTASLYITTFQAMLPQVLKSKYEKEVVRLSDEALGQPFDHLIPVDGSIDYDTLIDHLDDALSLKELIDAKKLMIRYVVKSRITKKYEKVVYPGDIEELEAHLASLSKNASVQKKIIAYFIEMNVSIKEKELCAILDINPANLKPLLTKGLIDIKEHEVYRDPYKRSFEQTEKLTLTDQQAVALRQIQAAIEAQKQETFLLYGVTGSGKTEVYLQAIDDVLQAGKEAIVLVPEISLTPQMVERFKGRFGSDVAVMHSALSVGERYDEWLKVQRKEVKVVVGARSAIFAPFENVGIIIIDEEHESTYKQEETPRYHARDVAIKRAEMNNCPVILGSATPTLESYARSLKDVYTLLILSERTNQQAMPKVDVIDMRAELHAGNRTMFSRQLMAGMKERIAKGEQIVLLLNRRGYSNFALCRDCGHVEQCPNCDISLTYHKGHHRLKCHYCQHEMPMSKTCPQCEGDAIRFFGTGTERVEEELTKLMPEVGIIRMDVDTTRRKGAHERLLNKFANQEADILLGTQMIAKGLDFENVTLVGVLAADSMLHLPDFRSAEKTFQLMTQVSGRAGRHELEGEVIVQSYTPDHYSIELASQYDYEAFYKREMGMRHAFLYPPYMFILLITVTHPNEFKANELAHEIRQYIDRHRGQQTTVLGPSPSPLARIKNKYRFQLMMKYRQESHIYDYIGRLSEVFKEALNQDAQIIIDFNPQHIM
ncbi:MAG TPA: primosomal protein N' [Pseudogracilibacillus sp.]|nr:primosomal protein N' [Pseudogracilibacillus sp.]